MSLYSGGSKKYSVNYFTPREEKFIGRFKTWYEKLGKVIPEQLTKIEEACKNEASGKIFI